MDSPGEIIDRHVTNSPAPGMYLKLMHGRLDPEQDMDEFGFDGPWIGPLDQFTVVYNNYIQMFFQDGSETGPFDSVDGSLHICDDLMHYKGAYYGDWAIVRVA